MSPIFRFPDAKTVRECISEHPLLQSDYHQKKGISSAIAELAAKRFANSKKIEVGVRYEVRFIINDLRSGKDGSTDETLPNLGKIGFASEEWRQISMLTAEALKECAIHEEFINH